MKAGKPQFDGHTFDSTDEVQFYKWCQEAVSCGVIASFEYHPDTMLVIPVTKYRKLEVNISKVKKIRSEKTVDKHLMASLEYTPDFILHHVSGQLFPKEYQDQHTVYVDVKPSYDLYKNSSKFSVLQKIVYHVLGIYVHKVEVEKFFTANGAPFCLKKFKKDGGPTGKWHKYGGIADKCAPRKQADLI